MLFKSVEIKVSIIVAVYNSEKTLHRCLDSLRNQTLRSIEVILVDDGSTDKSAQICDEYVSLDSRFCVIHKSNGGVSSARQCGISCAKGEYTIHVDPDDWVDVTMLEELYNFACREGVDMVICDYYYNDDKGQVICRQCPSELNHLTVLTELFKHLHGSCWNKLIRSSCYKKWDISFPKDVDCCEDLIFNVRILLNPIKIGYLPKAFYHYVHTLKSESLTQIYLQSKKSYETDILLTSILSNDIPSTIWNKHIFPLWEYHVMCRTFKHKCLTSKQFKQRFARSAKYIFQTSAFPKLKCFLLLSCMGFYKQVYWIYKFLK